MATLSVVVVTKNEEDNIGQCLESVKWADEIIVVDSQSTDKTIEIAKRYTDKIFTIKKDAHNGKLKKLPLQNTNKDLGMKKATEDWILFLDADEIATPEVRAEIQGVLKKDDKTFDGYLVLRKNMFLGKWMKHGGWWEYATNVELVRRGKGRWPIGIHQTLKVDGNVGHLKNPMIHNAHRSISQWIEKMDEYTSVEAKELHERKAKFQTEQAIFFPIAVFFRSYFLKAGYKDGFHGFTAATFASFYEFVKRTKLWEKQKSEYK